MFARLISVGVALLIGAAPAVAQVRGSMEFGAFGSAGSFDSKIGLDNGTGGGGRFGMFLTPRLSLEVDGLAMSASRASGFAGSDVNVGMIYGRALWAPVQWSRTSLLLGAGITHVDYAFFESYGFSALGGVKFGFSPSVALRVDGIADFLANSPHTNFGIRAGLSFYRSPARLTNTVTVVSTVPGPDRPDSVSAAEQRRLRNTAADYARLRDSLWANRAQPAVPSSASALATMKAMIHFYNDESVLTDSAKAILNEKVEVFRANPAMRIVIVGFASQPGTPAYNLALGTRRAEAAKAYLVAQGVDPIRIEIATRGEGGLLVEGPGEVADAENRRGQFRLLIADPYLVSPKH
jgi:outer membrane protein OmpA-like peptidoglycan-associated protein